MSQKRGGKFLSATKLLQVCYAFSLLFILLIPTSSEARYASIVMDSRTGQVLFSRNADDRLYPASLTKIMTLYMAFDALSRGELKFDQYLKVSKRAEGQTPTKLGLKAGSTIKVKDAIFGLITKSANDAATVLAEAMAPTEAAFARKMTKRAQKLGMSRTSFRNASGLPNRRQRSTARDMALLGAAMIHDFPQYYNYMSLQSFNYKGKSYKNHNNLLGKYAGADGIKTGYIRASGFNLVASAKRGSNRLIGVVFGGRSAKSRDLHMKKLLDKGFHKIENINPTIVPVPQARPVMASLGMSHRNSTATKTTYARAAAAPRPVKAVQIANNGRWGIQIGAFSRATKAKNQLLKAASLTGGMMKGRPFNIQRVMTKGTPIYRAQMIGFSQSEAQSVCRSLQRKAFTCFAVSPINGNLVKVALN
ncbi:MAG: D-alanyl-D-alanine carboxypeptidase [SAR86 cluster bacterium]|uniref:D-alanyl-D-alanine carboxypeptidase n=1 Tax=SAR86 cluster bacterium TaxID=2030880 RepID=A0A2A4X9T9_9GAMM|nr:D-alanyl-D-alanine carboxypeptidase [Sneathiella sp.]PCI78807.1 MAG: D-alanyl-D-alanine carboxypeptidase [SAR86 cluster bacterium]